SNPIPGVANFGRSPAVRAEWTGKYKLETEERSPLFGFTSNQPPTLDAVRLRGILGAAGANVPVGRTDEGTTGGVVGVGADGEVATPVGMETGGGGAPTVPFGGIGGQGLSS